MCLDQYYTLNNTDLFVKASDGGLKLTYTDVNNLSIPSQLTGGKILCTVSCKGLEASVSVIMTSTRFY